MLTRREFLKRLGIAAAAVPVVAAMPAGPEKPEEPLLESPWYKYIGFRGDYDIGRGYDIARIEVGGLLHAVDPQPWDAIGFNGLWENAAGFRPLQLTPDDTFGVNGTWYTYDGQTCHEWPHA